MYDYEDGETVYTYSITESQKLSKLLIKSAKAYIAMRRLERYYDVNRDKSEPVDFEFWDKESHRETCRPYQKPEKYQYYLDFLKNNFSEVYEKLYSDKARLCYFLPDYSLKWIVPHTASIHVPDTINIAVDSKGKWYWANKAEMIEDYKARHNVDNATAKDVLDEINQKGTENAL